MNSEKKDETVLLASQLDVSRLYRDRLEVRVEVDQLMPLPRARRCDREDTSSWRTCASHATWTFPGIKLGIGLFISPFA